LHFFFIIKTIIAATVTLFKSPLTRKLLLEVCVHYKQVKQQTVSFYALYF